VGGFISRDPSGFAADDLNLYRYVGNNSIIYVDPSGLYGVAGRAAIGGISGALTGAATGAVAGGLFGGPPGIAAGAVAGAISGGIGGLITGALMSCDATFNELATAGAIQGAIAGVLAGAPAGFASAKAVSAASNAQVLAEGQTFLAVVKDGEIIAKTSDIALSHAEFVRRSLGTLPDAAHVITFGKLKGEIIALNSKTFHGNQLPASQSVLDLLNSLFR